MRAKIIVKKQKILGLPPSWAIFKKEGSPRGVDTDQLEHLSLELIVDEELSVEDAEDGEDDDVGQQVEPDELEDAAMPDQHQPPEPLPRLPGVDILVAEQVPLLRVH